MRSPVLITHLLPLLAERLDEARIHDEFLSDGVPRQLPRELVLPARRLVVVLRVEDVGVVGAEIPMVLLDRGADGGHGLEGGGGEEANVRDGEVGEGEGLGGGEEFVHGESWKGRRGRGGGSYRGCFRKVWGGRGL